MGSDFNEFYTRLRLISSHLGHQVPALGGTNADGLEPRMGWMVVQAVGDEWPTYLSNVDSQTKSLILMAHNSLIYLWHTCGKGSYNRSNTDAASNAPEHLPFTVPLSLVYRQLRQGQA